MSDHARLSPSAAHRWMHCPGAPTLEATQPRRSSSYADEGTVLHALVADRLPYVRATRRIDFSDLIGRTVNNPDVAEPLTVTNEHANAMESCARVFLLESGGAPSTSCMIEQRVPIPGRDDLYGTADVMIVDRPLRRLSVIDWKFGAGVEVFAKENVQAIIYALAALLLLAGIEEIDTIRIIIHQPRVRDEPDVWVISVEQLRGYLPVILDAAKRTDREKTTYIDGDWCLFCNAKSVCPQLRTTALGVAKREFDNLVVATPEELSVAMDAIPRIEAFIRAVEAETLQRLARGEAVPNYQTSEGRRSRQYADEFTAGGWAQAMFGNEAFTAPTLLSPAQLEALAKRKKIDMPEHLWDWKTGALHVTRVDSGRAAVTSAQLDFDNLGDDP